MFDPVTLDNIGPDPELSPSLEPENDWFVVAEREVARPVACEILSATACQRDALMLGVADDLGHNTEGVAAELALAAWGHCAEKLGWVFGKFNADLYYLICLEAESLLQCGWSPGEPSELY